MAGVWPGSPGSSVGMRCAPDSRTNILIRKPSPRHMPPLESPRSSLTTLLVQMRLRSGHHKHPFHHILTLPLGPAMAGAWVYVLSHVSPGYTWMHASLWPTPVASTVLTDQRAKADMGKSLPTLTPSFPVTGWVGRAVYSKGFPAANG